MKPACAFGLLIAATSFGYSQDRESVPSSLTESDQLLIAVQKICPVTGKDLGTNGSPFKVKVGEQIAFLCCRECQKQKIDAKHWATIQSRIAKAQGTCPIMEHPVDETMKSVVVEGQKIFVCCPPCIEKIQADPKTNIQKVSKSFAKFIATEQQARSDQLHALAQGICPVSGKELGSMGDPVKVKVGKDEHAFLCCQGCVGKKLNADYWKTIQSNLATAQGVCPVMEQPVDSTMKSTVVKGRKIYVCCPPCIEKIEANTQHFIAKLDAQISERTDKNTTRK